MAQTQKNRIPFGVAVLMSISAYGASDGAGALARTLSVPPLLPASELARIDPPFTVFYPQDARRRVPFCPDGMAPT